MLGKNKENNLPNIDYAYNSFTSTSSSNLSTNNQKNYQQP